MKDHPLTAIGFDSQGAGRLTGDGAIPPRGGDVNYGDPTPGVLDMRPEIMIIDDTAQMTRKLVVKGDRSTTLAAGRRTQAMAVNLDGKGPSTKKGQSNTLKGDTKNKPLVIGEVTDHYENVPIKEDQSYPIPTKPYNVLDLGGGAGGANFRDDGKTPTLGTGGPGHGRHGIQHENVGLLRRMTPVECERLQGMPDDHTEIPWRGRRAIDCPLGPRHRAIGNSMAVPVMVWIGQRIQMVEDAVYAKNK